MQTIFICGFVLQQLFLKDFCSDISITLQGALEKSLKSLLDNADKPNRVEIMLGIDEDDQETKDWLDNKAQDFVKPYACGCKAKVFKPLGYKKLNIYVKP